MISTRELRLLRQVSRSFYISIRALPRPLREPVALAYLLARSADTIADNKAVDVSQRIELLDRFTNAIAGEQRNGRISQALRDFARGGGLGDGESRLLASGQLLLDQLRELTREDRASVRQLLSTITSGQRLDLIRWRGHCAALNNADELREYTYLVAGCVGEFWTQVCFRKLPHFSDRSEAEMLALGKKYGCGLQLVNVLRDAGEDLRAGRCYFPADELASAGLSAEKLLYAPPAFGPVFRHWIDQSKRGLQAGIDYSLAIKPASVRIATALPALIGIRTLRLLEQKGIAALQERVKVSRPEVRSLVAALLITLGNRRIILGNAN